MKAGRGRSFSRTLAHVDLELTLKPDTKLNDKLLPLADRLMGLFGKKSSNNIAAKKEFLAKAAKAKAAAARTAATSFNR